MINLRTLVKTSEFESKNRHRCLQFFVDRRVNENICKIFYQKARDLATHAVEPLSLHTAGPSNQLMELATIQIAAVVSQKNPFEKFQLSDMILNSMISQIFFQRRQWQRNSISVQQRRQGQSDQFWYITLSSGISINTDHTLKVNVTPVVNPPLRLTAGESTWQMERAAAAAEEVITGKNPRITIAKS